MDSTPNPNPILTPPPHLTIPKLPIKRKAPSPTDPTIDGSGIDLTTSPAADGGDDVVGCSDPSPPPFKFHRIWTEPDEIRFLRGLLDCSSQGLCFPRDLNVFYSRFSDSMSQPYTKSQLSEKLRRLRKKFRVISSRLARGLDKGLLSPHDRSLFELSERLWHPEFSSTSPFFDGGSSKQKKSNLVGIKVSFSPTLPTVSIPAPHLPIAADNNDEQLILGGFDVDDDVKLSDVNVEFDNSSLPEQDLTMPNGSNGGGIGCDSGGGLGKVAAETVINVFDQSLEAAKNALAGACNERKVDDFEKRWREQRVAELDVFARRLRLVLECSLIGN